MMTAERDEVQSLRRKQRQHMSDIAAAFKEIGYAARLCERGQALLYRRPASERQVPRNSLIDQMSGATVGSVQLRSYMSAREGCPTIFRWHVDHSALRITRADLDALGITQPKSGSPGYMHPRAGEKLELSLLEHELLVIGLWLPRWIEERDKVGGGLMAPVPMRTHTAAETAVWNYEWTQAANDAYHSWRDNHCENELIG